MPPRPSAGKASRCAALLLTPFFTQLFPVPADNKRMGLITNSRTCRAQAMTEYLQSAFTNTAHTRRTRAEVAAELATFRERVLGEPVVRGHARGGTWNSESWRPWARRRAAGRLCGLEHDLGRLTSTNDTTAQPLDIAVTKIVGRPAIDAFFLGVHTTHEELAAPLAPRLVTGFITASAELMVTGIIYVLTGQALRLGNYREAAFESLMCLFLLNPRGLFPRQSITTVHSKTLDVITQRRRDWQLHSYNLQVPQRFSNIAHKQKTNWELSASSCLYDTLGFSARSVVVGRTLWLGIDHLFTRDAATGEPALTFALRLTPHRPKYPKTAPQSQHTLALPKFAVGGSVG